MRRTLCRVFGIIACYCIRLQAADLLAAGAIPGGFSGRVNLVATDRARGARAVAYVPGDSPGAAVELTLSHLKPATLFGGDFNTYVVWKFLPAGADNVGEVLLGGNSGQLSFSVPV